MTPTMAACPAADRLAILSQAVDDAAHDLNTAYDPACRYGWSDARADWYSAAYTQAWQGFTASVAKRGMGHSWPEVG